MMVSGVSSQEPCCPECDTEVLWTARRCTACGADLQPGATSEDTRLDNTSPGAPSAGGTRTVHAEADHHTAADRDVAEGSPALPGYHDGAASGPRVLEGSPAASGHHDCAAFGSFDSDGYCLFCGLLQGKRVEAVNGDWVEADLGVMAGMSDRGMTHPTNEDAMGLAVLRLPVGGADSGAGGVAGADAAGGADGADAADAARTAMVAVVCDGVSTAPGSAQAAKVAAVTATAALTEWLAAAPPGGRRDDDEGDEDGDVASAMRVAVARAQHAVAELSLVGRLPGLAPSCTFAAAVVVGGMLTVGWLGDSRVYLLGPAGAVRMTEDDTVAAEAVRAGLIPADEAETGRGAHMITRWLGPESGDAIPHVATVALSGPGRVLVCSDGLWNYASAAATLAEHVEDLPAGSSAIEVARHLTRVALLSGGRDNITVVVMDITGTG